MVEWFAKHADVGSVRMMDSALIEALYRDEQERTAAFPIYYVNERPDELALARLLKAVAE
jgi:hypothetical protein